MKTSKEYKEKKNEILDAAQILFSTKGYEKCTVNNILDHVGIAKGTFYYYFKSKEEVLDSIINRVTEIIIERSEAIEANPELSPMKKFINIILSMNVQSEIDNELLDNLHKPENALTHQKTLTLMIEKIAPILNRIVDEGINKGVFKSNFPKEYIKIFLTSSITLLDDGIFKISSEEQYKITMALAFLLDKMLGLEDGTFWELIKQHYE